MRKLTAFVASLTLMAAQFLGISQAFAVAPSAPGNVTVSNASTANTKTNEARINVSWAEVAGAIAYVVEYTADGVMTPKSVSGKTTTSTVIENLNGGTSYSFVVKARNSDGETSVASSPAQTLVAQSIPAAPSAVSAVAGKGQVTLTWGAPANTGGLSLSDYKITALGVSTTSASATTSKVIDGLNAGAEYIFVIKANNSLGDSESATFQSVTVPNVPGIPTGVSAVVSGTSITASWLAPSDGGSTISGYKVFLINSDGVDVASNTGAALSATFSNVSAGTYTVKVLAQNIVGDSARSSASSSATIAAASNLQENTPTISTNPSTLNDREIGSDVSVSATAPSSGTVTITATGNPIGACTYANDVVTPVASND